jgi:hypothetical protein
MQPQAGLGQQVLKEGDALFELLDEKIPESLRLA